MVTMECNGIEQSLTGWGITRAKLLLISFAIDTFSFDITVKDMFTDPLFAYKDTVNVYNDGVRVFSGQITTLPIQGDVSGETQSYVASGPWWILARIVFQTPRTVYEGLSLLPVTVNSSRVLVFGTIDSNRNNGQMIGDAIAYAVKYFTVPLQMGTTSLDTPPPLLEVKDVTCADVIVYCAKWTPDSVGWFDYSTTPPTFNCKRRTELIAVTIDPLNASTSLVNKLSIKPRPDLQIPGVVFTFEQTVIVANVQKVALQSQTAGDITALDAIYHTFTLQNATGATPETPPVGLATAFFAATSGLLYEGQITLTEPDCTFILRTGNSMIFPTNCPARYQDMDALIQQVNYELVTGITTVTFGPPQQLGPQDFAAFLAASRAPTPGSNLAISGSTDGGNGNVTTPPAPNPFPNSTPTPGGGAPTISLELCDGTMVCVSGASGVCA